MPTYEYRCDDCGKLFEELQSFSEPPIDECLFCGGHSRRIVSGGAGVIFKGSGFYINDSKKSEKTEKIKPASSETATTSTDAAAAKTESSDTKTVSTEAKPPKETPVKVSSNKKSA